jgi:hypothetical protein
MLKETTLLDEISIEHGLYPLRELYRDLERLDPIRELERELESLDPLRELERELEPVVAFQNGYDSIGGKKRAFVCLNVESVAERDCRKRELARNKREREAWEFIMSWDDELFQFQFHLPKEEVLKIIGT